jgi:membrane-anchored protein YejM (alkaline phosphatase superfamily)
MKKNVYLLILDSFIFDKIGKQEYGPSATPFLDELKSKTINTTNMYSHGPFTEAGATPLLSGNALLNEGGYMHNLNTKKNHFIDVFKKNGYELFDVFHPFFMYSDKTLNKIDHQYFSSGFIFDSVFSNRLDYFISLREQRSLLKEEYEDVIRQLEITFTAWENFLNYNKETEDKYTLIKNATKNIDFNTNRYLLKNEYASFLTDKIKYADSVLNLKKDHPLFKIQDINPADLINEPIVNKYFYKDNKHFLLKVLLLQFWWNLRNNKISSKRFFKSIIDNIKSKKISGYLKSVIFTLSVGVFSYKYRRRNFLKEMPSFNAHVELTLKVLQKRDTNKPFMVKIHPEDLHNRTSFFSFDADNKETIVEEINALKTYLSKVSGNFNGSLIYDFSVVYVDLCIRRLFDGLKKMDLLDNTLVAITSDHGCSYVNSPVRDAFVNNFHTENYRIPLYIYMNDVHPYTYSHYYTNEDVLPTIYELCGISSPKNISGRSIIDKNYSHSYAISEYMGGGCPDMRLRPVNYIIRDEKFLIAYKVKISQVFGDGKIEEIYDLVADKSEENNLVLSNNFEIEKVQYLLNRIKNRHMDLQEQYKSVFNTGKKALSNISSIKKNKYE